MRAEDTIACKYLPGKTTIAKVDAVKRIQWIGGLGSFVACCALLPLAASRAQTWDLRTGEMEASSPLAANNDPLRAGAQEWRLDGRVTGLDTAHDAFALQSDIVVMGDSAEGQDLNPTGHRVLIDSQTQMWTPDGQIRPFSLAALKVGSEIMAIGRARYHPRGTQLFARLIVLPSGLPPAYERALQAQKAAATKRSQVLAVRPMPQMQPRIVAKPRRVFPQTAVAEPPESRLAARPAVPSRAKPQLPLRAASPLPTKPRLALQAPQISRTQSRLPASTAASSVASPRERVASLALPSRAVAPASAPRLAAPPQLSRAATSPTPLASPQFAARTHENRDNSLPDHLNAPRLQTPALAAQPREAARVAPFESQPNAPRRAPALQSADTQTNSPAPATTRAFTMTLPAPRDTRVPALSLAPTSLPDSRAAASAPLQSANDNRIIGTRANSPLPGALQVLAQSDFAQRAQTRYADLRAQQNAIAWSTFSGGARDDEKLVAITFDDGPHITGTPAILDILKREGAHATFFGGRAQRAKASRIAAPYRRRRPRYRQSFVASCAG